MKQTYLKWKNSFHKSIILLFLIIIFTGCQNKNDNRSQKIIVYTYHSFSDEWGAGPKLAQMFYDKYQIQVEFAECSDSGQLLSKLILEKDNPYADVVIGLDNVVAQKTYENNVLQSYVPKDYSKIDVDFFAQLNPFNKIDSEQDIENSNIILTPYDFSHFAFIFNTNSGLKKPACLEDLTLKEYSKKIILLDSRTSTPGLGFQTWVEKVYGENAQDYMNRLQNSILTVSPSWSVGYGMFTNGEAPLVISYTTSPAYHVEYNEGNQYVALQFTDGHVMQVEGAGIVKGCKNLKGAQLFIDFLISTQAQEIIPVTQWMFPVNKEVELPESYKAALIPEKTLN